MKHRANPALASNYIHSSALEESTQHQVVARRKPSLKTPTDSIVSILQPSSKGKQRTANPGPREPLTSRAHDHPVTIRGDFTDRTQSRRSSVQRGYDNFSGAQRELPGFKRATTIQRGNDVGAGRQYMRKLSCMRNGTLCVFYRG